MEVARHPDATRAVLKALISYPGTRFTVRLITTSQWTCSRAVSRSSK
jgi:hypothetical protein